MIDATNLISMIPTDLDPLLFSAQREEVEARIIVRDCKRVRTPCPDKKKILLTHPCPKRRGQR
jgi:hypothetical protein